MKYTSDQKWELAAVISGIGLITGLLDLTHHFLGYPAEIGLGFSILFMKVK